MRVPNEIIKIYAIVERMKKTYEYIITNSKFILHTMNISTFFGSFFGLANWALLGHTLLGRLSLCLVVIDEDRIGLDIVLISFGYLTLADEDRIEWSIWLWSRRYRYIKSIL